jgi:predicted kinase
MPKCYQLIGVPASGKSTWVSNQGWDLNKIAYISTDIFVELYAKQVGKTYSEVFGEYMPKAIELMMVEVRAAQRAGKDVIWDQTSTTLASRTRKFNSLPDYEHIAVIFKTPEPDDLARRLASRPGKVIPYEVMRSMIDHFEMPTEEEGFKEIRFAN